jgi:hypothetical protein
MTIHDLIKKYGTHTMSMVMRTAAEFVTNEAMEAEMVRMADDLQDALVEYASEDFEPPTVNNEVV